METVFMTDRGRIRQHNEDNGGVFLNAHGQVLAIVADGMGGHRAGDVASAMAVQKLQDVWTSSSVINEPNDATIWIREQVMNVNEAIHQHASKHEECKGMGTTIVLAICTSEFCTIVILEIAGAIYSVKMVLGKLQKTIPLSMSW